jgi:hypothetical protein
VAAQKAGAVPVAVDGLQNQVLRMDHQVTDQADGRPVEMEEEKLLK